MSNCWNSVSPLLILKSWENLHRELYTELADVDEKIYEDELPLIKLLKRIRSANCLVSEKDAQMWASGGGTEEELQNEEFLIDENIVQAASSEKTNEDDD